MGLRSKKVKGPNSTNMLISNAVLIRKTGTEQGTFGKLVHKDFECFTLELPNRGNKRGISCIPKGEYKAVWSYSPKFKRGMYLLTNVLNRSGIRVHSANYAGDSKKGYKKHLYGCIALGKRVGVLDGQKALLVSRPTVKKFEKLMNYKDFILEIR